MGLKGAPKALRYRTRADAETVACFEEKNSVAPFALVSADPLTPRAITDVLGKNSSIVEAVLTGINDTEAITLFCFINNALFFFIAKEYRPFFLLLISNFTKQS